MRHAGMLWDLRLAEGLFSLHSLGVFEWSYYIVSAMLFTTFWKKNENVVIHIVSVVNYQKQWRIFNELGGMNVKNK